MADKTVLSAMFFSQNAHNGLMFFCRTGMVANIGVAGIPAEESASS
jgi:hypothetical protein